MNSKPGSGGLDQNGAMAGKAVIVTGAGKGLGAAFARALAADKARVLVNNRRREGEPSTADAVAASLIQKGAEAVADYADVSAPGAAEAIVSCALRAFGAIDALVLNAGIEGRPALFEKIEAPSFHDVMEVNLHANVRLVAAALPYLKQSSAGRIVFISSAAGLYGARGLSAYAASKGALNGFALTLADELFRYRINVNILCPFAETPMTRRSGGGAAGEAALSPDLVAPVAVWLASSACEVTGETWVASGGRMRRARLLESRGGGAEDDAHFTSAWIAANAEDLGGLENAREFHTAQDSFNSIHAEARGGGR